MNKSLLTIIGLSANLFLLIGCADDQARTQIADTNVRLSKIEQQLVNSDSTANNQISTLNKLDALQSQIDQLNGKVDTLNHNQKVQKENQDQMINSLDLQVQDMQGSKKPASKKTEAVADEDTQTTEDKPIVVPANDKAENTKDAKTKLNKALGLIKDKNFPGAIKELKSLIKTFPKSPEAKEGEYYLSVCYLANKQYTEAISVAKKFASDNPNDKSAPDALRTEYLAQVKLGMDQAAQKTANYLNKMYPASSANKKVQASLKGGE